MADRVAQAEQTPEPLSHRGDIDPAGRHPPALPRHHPERLRRAADHGGDLGGPVALFEQPPDPPHLGVGVGGA